MNVLSLFDGMSCGQIALNRAGIAYDTYYASEIDKHAITVTQANYPETVQLGDVKNWREWGIDWSSIGLIMGGSPCQGFSFAGKGLAFDDPRSKLFFVFHEILEFVRSLNPEVKFLLENVRMKKEYLSVITGALRVEPVFINSALVSAQNRQRFYWTNWFFTVPEDRGVILSDIVQEIFQHERSFMKDKSNTIRVGGRNSPPGSRQSWDDVYDYTDREKSYAIDANYWKGGDLNQYFNKSRRQVIFQRPRGTNKGGIRALDGKTPAMTSSRWEQNNLISKTPVQINPYKKAGGWQPRMHERVFDLFGKSHSLTASCANTTNVPVNETFEKIGYRKLTPVECERLQTVPDDYTNHVSNTQRYRMLGNGWTVDVIAHILSFCGHHDLMWQPLQKGRVQCPTL